MYGLCQVEKANWRAATEDRAYVYGAADAALEELRYLVAPEYGHL
jgi:hypothetical protein